MLREKLKSRFLRPLLLLAALLALSQTASAWQGARLVASDKTTILCELVTNKQVITDAQYTPSEDIECYVTAYDPNNAPATQWYGASTGQNEIITTSSQFDLSYLSYQKGAFTLKKGVTYKMTVTFPTDGEPKAIKFTVGNSSVVDPDPTPSEYKYYLAGSWDWNNGKCQFTGSGRALTYEFKDFDCSNTFKINTDFGSQWYVVTGNNVTTIKESNNTNMKLKTPTSGVHDVIFTLNLGELGTPVSLDAVVVGSDVPVTGKKLYLQVGPSSNWIKSNATFSVQFSSDGPQYFFSSVSGETNIFVCEATLPADCSKVNLHRWSTDKSTWYNKIENITVDTSKNLIIVWDEATTHSDGSNCHWDTYIPKNDITKAGQVYLLAPQLNGGNISPEWMMETQDNGITYTLSNFAMRPVSTTGNECLADWPTVVWYDADGNYHSKKFENIANLPTGTGDMLPGWAYAATFTPASESLVMTPMSSTSFDYNGKDILPYIGILGRNFVQRNEYKTPLGDYSSGDEHRMGNTKLGWQEAYIQYDAAGYPLLDDNRQAYYNTYWPPRNNILMQADISTESEKVDPLNISVDALTFSLDEQKAMSGSFWMSSLKEQDEDAYSQLSLDVNTKYYRYVIPSMWMLGEFKLWTGWAGYKASWGAQWNSHLYWGPTADATVKAKETYYPSIETSTKNYNTNKQRLYFQTMELFIPVDASAEGAQASSFNFGAARLYMTEADGQAQIDSKTLEMHGGYYPSLGVFPSGYKLTGYTVTRYKYDPNAVADTYLPCDRNGNTGNDGVVVAKTGISYSNATEFAADFEKGGVFERYVDDNLYAPGLYIYSLDVVFTATDGSQKVRKSKVWSPYIEILDSKVNLDLKCAQLIELPADNNFGGYSHVTYSTTGDRVLVKIEGDKVTKAGRLNDLVSASELPAVVADIYENTGAWTNITLLRTAKPSLYVQNGGKDSDIEVFSISKDGLVIADLTEVTPIDGYRYTFYDNGTTFGAQEFTAWFRGMYYTENGEGQTAKPDVPARTTYQPRFMLPGFRDGGIGLSGAQFPYEDSFTGTHDMLKAEGVSASTHTVSLMATLGITLPKISKNTEGLREAVYNAIAMQLSLDGAAAKSLTVKADESVDNALVQYGYQSPYDWMELVNPNAALEERQWKAIPHSWSLDGTQFTGGIEGVTPTLSTIDKTLELNPAFFAPTVEYFNAYKVNVPVEDKENTYVTKVMIRSAKVNHTDAETGDADRVADNDFMPVNQYSAYVAVAKSNIDDTLYEGDLMSNAAALSESDHTLIWTSDEFNWYAEMNDFKPNLTAYLSYAYVFKAKPGRTDETYFVGLEGDFPYIRYDRRAAAGEAPRRVAPGTASTTLAADDDAFIFTPVYKAFSLDEIQTSVEGIEAEGATIVVGKGFIDLMGVQGNVYAADGRIAYSGADRVELAAGVYVVKTARETLKVIVK